MATVDRKSALCDQTRLTGIDFIQVVEPQVQTRLRVFFGVEPSLLDVPMVAPAALLPAGTLVPELALTASIVSDEAGRDVEIDTLAWLLVSTPAGDRVALEITVPEPGDFSIHRLTLNDPNDRVDPFFNAVAFSFKQGCPSRFDCRLPCLPEKETGVDFQIDYLARDFHSYRRALLDFAAERYPQWSEPLEADQAVMLVEIMAALGDEFAYTQDRFHIESSLVSATQRRSRSALARLVDYFPDPGHAAETELAVSVTAGQGGAAAAQGARIWAMPEGEPPIPFSVAESVWHHENWNAPRLHWPDSDVACLPKGSTSAFLVTASPTMAEMPPGWSLTPEAFWQGRRAILRCRPQDAGEKARAFPITLTSAARLTDYLVETGGAPTQITRITWTEPTPWPLRLADTVVLLNIVKAVAGEEITEYFRIGTDDEAKGRHAGLSTAEIKAVLALPRAVEREGPHDNDSSTRGRVLRYGLRASETRGLGWTGARDPLGLGTESGQTPRLELTEVLPPALNPDPGADAWEFHRDLLATDLDTAAFTLEEGMWRKVVTHQTPYQDIVFQDYADNRGWTIRFGDGAFGRQPERGAVFRVRYFSGPGTRANLAPESVSHLTPPPQAPAGTQLTYAEAVTNPLPISSGRSEESAESICINAPEAFRALVLRAVRPEDFRTIIERMSWIQRANASTRWTGSWSTEFIAADPLGGFALTDQQRAKLSHAVDCIRQAARDARAADPDYLDIDLFVQVCVCENAYPGEVAPRIKKALTAFFNPDNFTFGQPLRRSALEAAVQAVPGVKGIDRIDIRVRCHYDWIEFLETEIKAEPSQIIRLQNDPQFPGRGSFQVKAHGGAA